MLTVIAKGEQRLLHASSLIALAAFTPHNCGSWTSQAAKPSEARAMILASILASLLASRSCSGKRTSSSG